MKKSLIALAVLASSGAAMAQSSVTLFGIVDAAVTRASGGGNGHVTGLSSGGIATSRLGFRGTEDLGGGLAASFWLEGALAVDNGNANGFNFQRRSTVSLSGPFGEVRLGRDYTPMFWNITTFDPYGTRGVGQMLDINTAGTNPVRNSNSIGYFLPATLGGFYGQVQYAFGEQNSTAFNDKSGNSAGIRLGFANGPLNVAAAYGETKQLFSAGPIAAVPATATTAFRPAVPGTFGSDLKQANIGASYDLGVVKPAFYYGSSKLRANTTGAADTRLNTLMLAATAPLGAGELRASYARYDVKNSSNDANKFAIGYGYNLSKRTQIYTTLARLKNKGNATYGIAGPGGLDGLAAPLAQPGRSATGFDLGVKHSF